jgi:LysR family transcriptional regulator, hydrogen peroxide-inducible genes activator
MAGTLDELSGITLTQLAYAVALDTHRHFGAAASACQVTQPTLSMQLRKLEDTLGVTLFDRSRNPVVPTDHGALLIAQARTVLREAARLPEIVREASGSVAGEVRFGVIPTLAPYLLPAMVPHLARRFPRLELIVEERVTDDVIDALRHDRIDAGLIASSVEGVDLTERILFTEPFMGYVSAGHRLARRKTITPDDLSLDDLWLLSDGHCFRAQAVQLCEGREDRSARSAKACTVGARFESGNFDTLKRLVESGVGMTLLPALAAAEIGDAGTAVLKRFAEPAPTRTVRVIRRRSTLRQRLVDSVVEVLLETLPGKLPVRVVR